MARRPHKSLSLREILQILPGAQYEGVLTEVHSCASFDLAKAGDLCFLRRPEQIFKIRSGCLCIAPKEFYQKEIPALWVDSVELALDQLMEYWDPWFDPRVGISPSAEVHPSAVIEGWVSEGARIGPFCFVAKGAVVGPDCVLESHVALGPRCFLGRGVEIFSGASLASQGFGFGADLLAPSNSLRHWGGVEIGDRVRISNQCNIAAGLFYPTELGADCKIDALVQIGHNCIIGPSCYMAGQSGLAGSVQLGQGVLIGGGASISGHLCIGDGAQIGGRSVVLKDVAAKQRVSGFPAREHRQWLRGLAKLYKAL